MWRGTWKRDRFSEEFHPRNLHSQMFCELPNTHTHTHAMHRRVKTIHGLYYYAEQLCYLFRCTINPYFTSANIFLNTIRKMVNEVAATISFKFGEENFRRKTIIRILITLWSLSKWLRYQRHTLGIVSSSITMQIMALFSLKCLKCLNKDFNWPRFFKPLHYLPHCGVKRFYCFLLTISRSR